MCILRDLPPTLNPTFELEIPTNIVNYCGHTPDAFDDSTLASGIGRLNRTRRMHIDHVYFLHLASCNFTFHQKGILPMKKVTPPSVTIEEAVSRMVNMDYIPPGLTLLEMTGAFLEEAEVEYENAKIDRMSEGRIAHFKSRMDSCSARHELVQRLLDSLQHEINNPKGSIIVCGNTYSGEQRITLESVSDWAADRYGIGISRHTHDLNIVVDSNKKVCWKDVTIKIWKDYKIGFSFKNGKYKRSHFREIGLMGKSKNTPNQLGIILIGLSKKKIFPNGEYLKGGDKTAISKLRRVLYAWTGLSEEPFYQYNRGEGFQPKFELKYDVNNADERAKEKAKNVDIDKLNNRDKAKLCIDYNDDLIDYIDSHDAG